MEITWIVRRWGRIKPKTRRNDKDYDWCRSY
nr:MAG TPA: hypothetical protein [Caudoviricetes sp.]